MTKTAITRERIELIANFHRAMTLPPSHDEIEELAHIALAAMIGEPVILYRERNPYNGLTTGWQEITENEFSFLKENAGENAEFLTLYRHAQAAPVVPEEKPIPNTLSMYAVDAVAAIAEVKGWNACRAAMLQELKKSAGTEAICRSDENVQVLHTKSPAQSDCCPAQNQGWIPVSERMPPSRHEVLVGRWWGEKPRWCCKWATYIPGYPDSQSSGWLIPGASWTPTHWMELPAAPQEVK